MSLPRFYPVFDSAAWVARAVPLGVKLVQLRIKDAPEEVLRAEITTALDLCRQHGALLVVNDHWQLAIELGADWLHLGQEDLDSADIPAIRAAGLKLGLSTHDHAELDRALALAPDYIALGPVYPTILKKMKWTEQGLDRLTEWKARIGDIPLCAIGGMSVARAPGAFAAGADTVAAVTDITLNADPEARMREWLEVTA
ncbi:thiamine phosphate synthase [Sulfitobacter sp. KE29]|uniref:Thiamine-phosphate synthase n=3 Tax=Sulfitobacter TaxID=60136 RepID=A0ABZ0V506_9RHOB|nr:MULTISPECIES: thiamine phosphate synthase [Sulfitobacter]MBO9439473.1 thiamine phosphate synthase [Sulfitobacter sp. R18_2]MDF3416933.1 thiamine phosphate synthase [Sulfitobacter sp. Ks38]MDF3424415.1 thiamine phosphate synthase [Sulfitobacter sp. KE29]MDF3427995.1 thiamine phosphate synthase [Sulfitobacter sp. S46]MDF3442767.1 thiamine phosphate synthase [Sulfitobacter sp. KE31]